MIEFPNLPPIPDGQYRTLMADPPRVYDDDMPGPGRGSSSHYDTLHYGTVLGMAPQIRKVTAPSAHLYLWTTNSFMEEALQIANAWGFDQKTIITWFKVQEEPRELPHERDFSVDVKERIGMGHYFRNVTEHILFCVKGNLGVQENNIPNFFFAERDEHSRKPDKAYRLAEIQSPKPRLELFSRSNRSGWDTWGDETQLDASLDEYATE
jgi:N6-adenosine-specific RNA methylase IME4